MHDGVHAACQCGRLLGPGAIRIGRFPRGRCRALGPSAASPRRLVSAGESVGYGGDWTASRDTPVAILNLGYADGYRRAFTAVGSARAGNAVLPLAGRVSMDLIAVDLSAAPGVREGDWLAIDYDLVAAERATGASQYELLTGLGARFDRVWI